MPSDAANEIKTIVAGLRKSSLLAGLTDRQMKRLASYAKMRRLPKDAVVVKRGDKGIGFYVVLDGAVQV
ncbi:MAG: cyclic nucleotide-binding domain-containing protein, partial [Thermoplasmata archaeon]